MAGKKKNEPKAKKTPAKKSSAKKDVATKIDVTPRAAQLRGKLTEAMQDPLTRDQIVRAIRAMLLEK